MERIRPGDEPLAPVHDSRRHTISIVLGVLLLVALVAFVVDNRDDTRISYVFGDVNAPLFVVLIATALVGMLIGWLLSMYRQHRRGS